MKYKVTASYTITCVAEVEADTADDAHLQAKTMDGENYEQKELSNWTVQSIELLPENFTEEQQAFINSYLRNVADAPRDVVQAFMLAQDDDDFYKEYCGEYYTGLADARGVWADARKYFKDGKA
tara:strand:- start:458 stop:829 length:372 start_codon:yes stop_codon:yes gene_type:complete